MRVVLDTNIVVAGMRSPSGASAELLRRVRARRLIALSSVPLFTEYEAVATRQEHLVAAQASVSEIEAVLDVLALYVEPVEIHFLWRPWLSDPADDMVLEVAVNGRADALVTFNTGDFKGVREAFGIELATPREILRRS